MQRIKFIDRMSTGKLSRREMLKSATAFGVGLTVLPRLTRGRRGADLPRMGGL